MRRYWASRAIVGRWRGLKLSGPPAAAPAAGRPRSGSRVSPRLGRAWSSSEVLKERGHSASHRVIGAIGERRHVREEKRRARAEGSRRFRHLFIQRRRAVSRASLLAGASLAALAPVGSSGVAQAACVPSPRSSPRRPLARSSATEGPSPSPAAAASRAIRDGVDALRCSITTLTNQSGGRSAAEAAALGPGRRGRVERQHDHDADEQRRDQRRKGRLRRRGRRGRVECKGIDNRLAQQRVRRHDHRRNWRLVRRAT